MPKNHRQNTNFQIAHFIAGACHTPDGAWSQLCDLKEDRQRAIDHFKVQELRTEAEEMKAKWIIENSDNAVDIKLAEAMLLEIENGRRDGKIHYDAALDEIAFIDECMSRLENLRQYKDLPEQEAHEASQQEEWKLELIRRAENSLATVGFVPTDHFATMRLHPEFQDEILPKIQEMSKRCKAAGIEGFQRELSQLPQFLLEA